jgi:hypothetical protein
MGPRMLAKKDLIKQASGRSSGCIVSGPRPTLVKLGYDRKDKTVKRMRAISASYPCCSKM